MLPPPSIAPRTLLALQAFELAVRYGSFKMAAEELHLTPSAVSHRIKGLEKLLGEALFDRNPRGVTPTAAGDRLAASTSRAFGELTRALAQSAGRDGRLRLSAVPIVASHWLLPILGRFFEKHPEVSLQVEANTHNVDMASGLVDVALRYGSGEWPGLVADRILTLSLVPVASPALAKRLRLGRDADVAKAPLIRTFPFGPAWSAWAERAGLDPADFGERGAIEVDGAGAALRAASHGLGVALAFEQLIGNEIAAGDLVRVGSVTPSPGEVWLVCRPQDRSRPAIRALRRWLLAEAERS